MLHTKYGAEEGKERRLEGEGEKRLGKKIRNQSFT